MALDQEIKMKNLVYLFFSIFICLCFIGCKLNINNQLLEMKDNDAYFTNRPTPDCFPGSIPAASESAIESSPSDIHGKSAE